MLFLPILFKDRKFVLVLLHKYKFLTFTVLKSFALSTLISIAGRKAANPTTKFRVLPSGLPIGGDEQNRTVDPLLARQVLSQLSYTPVFVLITISELLSIHLNYYSLFKDALHSSLLTWRLVGSSGLEPPTSRLSGVRSNHLSYEPVLRVLEPSKLNNALKVSLTLE